MKQKIIIALFLLIFFGTAYIQYVNSLPKEKMVAPSLLLVKQTVANGGGKLTSPVRVKVGTTALQLLSSTHTTVTKGERENAFVTKINGREALDSKREFWALYVNGKQAEVGAGSYILKNNDTIEWKIGTY